jgi:peroxiredoxin
LAAGDVVLQLDGQSVSAPSDVVAIVRERRAGERVSVGFRRGERERLVAAVLAAVPSSDQVLKMSYLGAPAPRLGPLKTVQGSLLPGLDTLRGKVTVIEFWASWCGVCPILVPTMNDWHARYGAQGVQVVGITTDQVAAAASTASRQGMAYPIWSDESGETTEAYRALALPTVFVLDRSGVVRDVMVGYSSVRVAELESLVGRLLAQQ